MQDNRQYIIKPFAFWTSDRAKHLFRIKDSELEDAKLHPQGIIREEEDRVLVIEQDPKAYVMNKKPSEVLKRHNAKQVGAKKGEGRPKN